MEHRRELPVPLRAFVRRHSRLDGGGTLLGGMLLLGVSVAVAATVGAGAATFVFGAVAFPFTYFVTAARRLAHLGFAHQDLAPAFASELERAREELQVAQRDPQPTRLERGLASVTRIAGAVPVLAAAGDYAFADGLLWAMGATPLLLGLLSVATGIGWFSLAQRRRDLDTAFWGTLWTGPMGRALFAIARRTIGRDNRANAVTHRATELSLGLAGVELFEGLPRPMRETLGDVPAVLRRLQEDAQVLRAKHDDVAQALEVAGESASHEGYAGVRAVRDELGARLKDTVTAMETIRLQLLRLHAGSVTTQQVTTHVGMAREVSEQVSRLIAAQGEVERSLGGRSTAAPVRRAELAATPTGA